MRLKNKVCLITGAASGMGRIACDIFAKEGAKIIALDVNAKDGESLTKEALDKGYLLKFMRCDVSRPAQVKKAIDLGVKRFGKLDVIYNNAGVFLKDDASVLETTPEVWDKTLDINLKGMYLVCKYGIPYLLNNAKNGGSGSVINISSIVALVGCTVAQDAYTVSKGGVLALTKSLAIQYGRQNVRANAICPGPIETPLLTRWLFANPKEKEKRIVRQPMGRFGKPEEIVYGALYLASDESSWTNGAALVIDGGLTSNYF
ncbi:MAG: SDR family oxidoreductase [Elusimicrobiota bacterium]